ncbi:hypothetical protein CG740_00725 [Streptomyces sp. CB01201]|nr:hypothetical protein CG740_00725 [Streptomyces sp. CB01201]
MTASETQTVEGAWEYVTYAPAGSRCCACMQPIRALEPVRRGSIGRALEPSVVVYRHADKCPATQR